MNISAVSRRVHESEPSDSNLSLTKAASGFNFEDFFLGHTRASGWFADRFGKPRRHFCGDFYGSYRNDKFILDESLFYTDGAFETRQWAISVSRSGEFTAESDSLIDGARGFIHGNTLLMQYSMKVMIEKGKYWDLDMKDLMVLQPDGSLHNINHVSKWGMRLGTVSAHYRRHNGDSLCSAQSRGLDEATRPNLVSVKQRG